MSPGSSVRVFPPLCALVVLLAGAGPLDAQTFVNPILSASSRAVDLSGFRLRDDAVARELVRGDRPQMTSAARTAWASRWTQHASYASDRFDEFRQALEIFRTDPKRATVRLAEEDRAFVAAHLAGVAANPIDAREARDLAGERAPEVARAQRVLVRALRAAEAVMDGVPIIVFATGTARETLDSGDEAEAGSAIGTGSLGAQIGFPSGKLTALLAIVGDDDPMTTGFSRSVLSPMSGRGLASALLDYRGRGGPLWGWAPNHHYVTISSARWQPAGAPEPVAATILGIGALWSATVLESAIGQTEVALTLDAGPTFRYIGGDAGRSSAVSELMNGRQGVWGLESGFGLSFGRVTAAAQAYLLEAKNVDGLHGLHLVAGLSVSGEFIRDRLPL